MASELKPKQIENIGVYGLIRQAEVDDNLIPDEAVTEVINFHFDRKGAATVRPGMTTLGATIQAGYPIWGLHNAQNGTMFAALSQGGSMRVYAFPSGGTWASSLTGGTANVRLRFLEAGGRTIVLNFGLSTNMYSSVRFLDTSGAWVTTGNPINPQGLTDQIAGSPQPQFGEVFKSRIYLAGGNTDGSNLTSSRLWFSSVISSSGNYTWNPTTDYVDINPNDGENITALKRYSLELLVFKPNYMYRFKTAGTDPDPIITVGTRSQESVIEGKRGVYFHHESGFYRYAGGYPVEVSRAISDIVAAIPYAQFDDVPAWKDGDHICWALGDLTVEGVTWANVVIRYSESSEIWTVYSYANEVKTAATYNSGAAVSRVLGLDNGAVATFDVGTSDLGEPIKYRLRTKWYVWDGLATRKNIQELLAFCERAQISELMYQVDEKLEIQTIGQLTKMINFFDKQDIKFHRIRFFVVGMSRNESPIFRGIEITKGINQGL